MRLVVLGRELLLDALLELPEDLLERDLATRSVHGRLGRLLLLPHLGLQLAREVEELLLVGEERGFVRENGRARRRLRLFGRRRLLGASGHLVRERAAELRVEDGLEVLREDVRKRGPRVLPLPAVQARAALRDLGVAGELALEGLQPFGGVDDHSLLEAEVDLEKLLGGRLVLCRRGRRGLRGRGRFRPA